MLPPFDINFVMNDESVESIFEESINGRKELLDGPVKNKVAKVWLLPP